MPQDDEENPAVKAEREKQALMLRIEVAKRVHTEEFEKMVKDEHYWEDKVALLKARAADNFKRGLLDDAVSLYTRAIGIHACKGDPAPHALYSNRSACRCVACAATRKFATRDSRTRAAAIPNVLNISIPDVLNISVPRVPGAAWATTRAPSPTPRSV